MRVANVIGCMWLLLAAGDAGAAPAAAARHVLVLPGGPAPESETGQGNIRFVGADSALIRYRGVTILSDLAPTVEALPAPDVVLLSRFEQGQVERLLWHKIGRDVPIVASERSAVALRAAGFTRLYPLPIWQSLLLKKGQARLRLTALPERPGVAGGRTGNGDVNLMLDFGGAGAGASRPWRLYISGETLPPDEWLDLARRLPGADLVLLHAGDSRLLAVLADGEDPGRGRRMARLIAPAPGDDAHAPAPFPVKLGRWRGMVAYQPPGTAYVFTRPSR